MTFDKFDEWWKIVTGPDQGGWDTSEDVARHAWFVQQKRIDELQGELENLEYAATEESW